MLAYNVGCGKVMKSRMYAKMRSGNRNIYRDYVDFKRWNGKIGLGIEIMLAANDALGNFLQIVGSLQFARQKGFVLKAESKKYTFSKRFLPP